MRPLEVSTFTLILTPGIWPKQKKMKKMTMNLICGHCQTVPTLPSKMAIERGSILESKVSYLLSLNTGFMFVNESYFYWILRSQQCNSKIQYNESKSTSKTLQSRNETTIQSGPFSRAMGTH